jgi:hypothetical protein
MSDDLKLPQVGELTLPQWQDWLVRYNAVLGKCERRIEKPEAALLEIGQTFISQLKSKPEQWINKMTLIMSHEEAVEAYEELGRRIQIARKALEGKDDT